MAIVAIHLAAMLAPIMFQTPVGHERHPHFEGWPATFQGRPLTPLQADAVEARFAERFPGRLARFTDGDRELVFRYLQRPTRQLHAAADCFKGAGYAVDPQPVRRDAQGKLMGCILAERDGRSVRVCERVYDARGGSWYDVSSWFWAAVLKQTTGPWWAVTVAEPI